MTRVRLVARLLDSKGRPLQGKTIEFYMDGSRVGSAQTATDGSAIIEVDVSQGSHLFKAVFSGDSDYEPSEARVLYMVPGAGGGGGATTTITTAPAKAGFPWWLVLLLLLLLALSTRRRR